MRKTIVEVPRGVTCICRVVCGESWRGTDRSFGWRDTGIELAGAEGDEASDCRTRAAGEEAIMKGIKGSESRQCPSQMNVLMRTSIL